MTSLNWVPCFCARAPRSNRARGLFSSLQWIPLLGAAALALAAWVPSQAQAAGPGARSYTGGNGDVYLGGNFIQFGIAANGSSGNVSTSVATANIALSAASKTPFYTRKTGSYMGFLGDADGFGVGKDLRIDYFLPGSPTEGWGVGYNDGSNHVSANKNGATGITYACTDASAGATLTVNCTGTYNAALKVDQAISFDVNAKAVKYDITLTNLTGSTMNSVRFLRNVDPDNTQDQGGSFSTINTVVNQGGAGNAVIEAKSLAGDAYALLAGSQAVLQYFSADARARVFNNTSSFDPYNAVYAAPPASGTTNTGDTNFSMWFAETNLAAAASTTFTYYAVMRATGGVVSTSPTTDYSFSANDYQFQAPNAALNSVVIKTLPAVGTLYVDGNGNGTVNGGETVVINDDVFANLANLKFKPAPGATATNSYDTFTFQVNADVTQTYTMTVGIIADPNVAPTASSVQISGVVQIGTQLTGAYTYSDADSDTQGTSTLRWTRDTLSSGASMAAISGATSSTYVVQDGDAGKYLFFCVTPKASAGVLTGSETCSAATIQVPVINGSCGLADGVGRSTTPEAYLCARGSIGAVSGSGPWAWSCVGSTGGTTANCAAPYVEPPVPLPTGGSNANVGSGATVVVSANGSIGSTLNLGNASAATTNNVQLPGGGTVTVSSNGASQLSVTQVTATGSGSPQTVLDLVSGQTAITANQANQPLGTVSGLILVSANNTGAQATLIAGRAPTVNTSGQTTVTLLGTPAQVSGATLNLTGTSSGGAAITFLANPSATPVLLTPGSTGATFMVQPVLQSNGSTLSALLITSGSVTLTVPASSFTGIAAGSAPVTTGGASTTVTLTAQSGQQLLSVGSGFIILPALAQTRSSAASSMILADNKVYAGETVVLDAGGKVTAAYLGSASATEGIAGDALSLPVISGLTFNTLVPNLSGSSARLNANLETSVLTLLQQNMLTRQGATDNQGAMTFSGGGSTYRAMPLGRISIDNRLADGMSFMGNGLVALTTSGVRTMLAPASSNLVTLAAYVKSKGGRTMVMDDGTLLISMTTPSSIAASTDASAAHLYYALQPGYEIRSVAAGESMLNGDRGALIYTDPQGRQQTLYPAMADFANLEAEVLKIDATGSVVGMGNGTLQVTLNGKRYTLRPDNYLTVAPPSGSSQAWWLGQDGKLYIGARVAFFGNVQGFTVE